MHQQLNANTNQFYQFTAICMAIGLFVAGRFGFFDILGIKRLFEVILFVPLSILGFLLIDISAAYHSPWLFFISVILSSFSVLHTLTHSCLLIC